MTIGNRRKTERLHMLAGARVRVGGVSHEALLHDCSRIGCRLTMDQELPRGEEVHLTLALPGSNFPIEVEGVVTWCSPIDFSQSFQLGFSFLQFARPAYFGQLALAVENEQNRREELLNPGALRAEDVMLAQMSPFEVRRLAFLTTLSRQLNRSHDTAEVAQIAVDNISGAMRAERVLIILGRGGADLEILAARGTGPEPSSASTSPIYSFSRSLAQRVLEDGQPVLSFDVESDEALSNSASLDLIGTRSILCIPLLCRDKTFGLLYLDNQMERAAFSQSDLEIARVLSELVAAALERGRLFSQLVQTEKMSALGTLTASLAHELANPLAVVSGISELLESEPIDQDLVQDLVSATRRCHALIKDITNWSRLDEEVPEDIQFKEVMSATLPLILPEIQRSRVQFTLNMEPDLPPVRANVNKLSQVLVNLINNSIQALKGRKDGEVSVVASANTSDMFVRVTDNGPGIPAAHLGRIFDPFFTTKAKGEGTGLGLSISRDILSRYGGTIEARNLPTRGAQLTFQLAAREKVKVLAG